MCMLRKIFKYKNNFVRSVFSKSQISKFNNHNYIIFFDKKNTNELSKLANLHKTNKGYELDQDNAESLNIKDCHSYSDFYSDIFLLSKKHVKKVFELGIGSVNPDQSYNMLSQGKNYKTGGSLRMWRDYFQNAHIYGADIDRECLFSEQRIKTFEVNQGEKNSVKQMWDKVDTDDFDIIIDDGCHRFEETINFYECSIDKLAENGIYIIEDILLSQRKKFLNYFKNSKCNFKFIEFHRPDIKHLNNSLIMITK